MTAIGLMQLRDQGLFDLDDPVNKFLATGSPIEPPAGGADVTFRHLLTHTAGIGEVPRVSDLVRPKAWGMGKPGTAGADLAAIYRGTLRPDSVAGSKWAYANHGFAVLGQLVEDISGRPFAEHMLEQLFDPLGMASTEYTRTDRTTGRVATGLPLVVRPLQRAQGLRLGAARARLGAVVAGRHGRLRRVAAAWWRRAPTVTCCAPPRWPR